MEPRRPRRTPRRRSPRSATVSSTRTRSWVRSSSASPIAETPASQLTVTAGADGTSVFPADGITLGGSGAVRSITLTPFEATTGTANITLTVIDAEGAVSARSFQVTVNARNASIRDWR